MQKRTKIFIAGAGVIGALSVGVGVAAGGVSGATGNDNETPIRGSALARASAAALDHTGQGRVTDTEVGDEESYYEVEVRLDDGSEVDVQLDAAFTVVGKDGPDRPGQDD